MNAIHHQRQHLRRKVCLMLMVWLFALGAGLVNACVLDAHQRGSVAHEHEETTEQGAGQKQCLKFCLDESSAIAKSSLPLDAPLVALSPLPWPGLLMPEQPCRALLHLRTPPAQGPPLSIRLLHLSL